MHWWKEPLAGDIVWCYFPDDLKTEPAQKPRPALVLSVYKDPHRPHECGVLVVYGTSQKVATLYAGEFTITRTDGEDYRDAGLSYDTKFNMARSIKLPFNNLYFDVPPGAPHGQQPKLGVLHPSLMVKVGAAYRATGSKKPP